MDSTSKLIIEANTKRLAAIVDILKLQGKTNAAAKVTTNDWNINTLRDNLYKPVKEYDEKTGKEVERQVLMASDLDGLDSIIKSMNLGTTFDKKVAYNEFSKAVGDEADKLFEQGRITDGVNLIMNSDSGRGTPESIAMISEATIRAATSLSARMANVLPDKMEWANPKVIGKGYEGWAKSSGIDISKDPAKTLAKALYDQLVNLVKGGHLTAGNYLGNSKRDLAYFVAETMITGR
jgi:hypothetical protein